MSMTQPINSTICENCFSFDARPFAIGRDRGGQRDPWRMTVNLCPNCTACLEQGDFAGLHNRYKSERTISRKDLTGH